MKKIALAATALVFIASTAFAATTAPLPAASNPKPRHYQVTGHVLAVTDTKIIIGTGKQKWEIARDSKTKIAAGIKDNVKVGTKLTVQYTMTAVAITDKPIGPAGKLRRMGKKGHR